MGNRIGSHKQRDAKTKDDKKKEKEAKKEKERQLKKEKKGRRKKQQVSGLDTDLDDSSHVTGGDSESCVFHSAENISASPYLDASTRSEIEQASSWSGMNESFTSASQHPHVLSAKDFKDGFSLEACIPPEIARREPLCDDGTSSTASRFEGRSGSSVRSRKSSNSVKSSSAQPHSHHDTPTSFRSHHATDDVGSVGTSSQISGEYHTPLLSTPVFGRVDGHTSTTSLTSSFKKVSETNPNDCMDISPTPSTFHHPHFYNHQKLKFQKPPQKDVGGPPSLQKPTSPYPQRRALSPKMTSSPIKLISSDDSSSSHTTPTPQRRANLLDLFRTGKPKESKSSAKQGEGTLDFKGDDSSSGNNVNETKVKNKPLWKTWERSKKKKDKSSKTSIFGTTRKSERKKSDRNSLPENENGTTKINKDDTKESSETKHLQKTNTWNFILKKKDTHRTDSSKSSDSNYDLQDKRSEDYSIRSSSSPIARSAAFCIMKLEELERSIEETIREKFPDAEPFLLKKRSKEDEMRGSRSLPSTPSLKKKLYVARDVNDSKRNSQKEKENNHNDASDKTRYCDETFETCPSPAMSPVILRRFGARTRHASISPKIPRAKTAVLYNSPSDISTMEKSVSTKTVTKVPVYNAMSSFPHLAAAQSVQFMKPLTAAVKSESKYDNVVDETDALVPLFPATAKSSQGEQSDSDEDIEYNNLSVNSDKPVIVPTFSAVFGSVSPKLKRHLESKFNEINTPKSNQTGPAPLVERRNDKVIEIEKIKQNNSVGSLKGNNSRNIVIKGENHFTSEEKAFETAHQKTTKSSETLTSVSVIPEVTSVSVTIASPTNRSVSVRQRVTTINTSSSNDANQLPGSNNAGTSDGTHLHKATAAQNQELPPDPGVAEQHKTRERAHGRPCVPQQASRVDTTAGDTEKFAVRSSPGAQRKHSSDHVVFGSAVALPCRLYSNAPLSPTSECLEDTGNVNISNSEVSRENIAGQSQNVRHVTKQKSSLCKKDNSEQARLYCSTPKEQTTTISSFSARTIKPIVISVPISNVDVVEDISTPQDIRDVSNQSNERNNQQILFVTEKRATYATSTHAKKDVSLNEPNAVPTKIYRKPDILNIVENITEEQNEYRPNFRKDEQKFVVLRNPVSKVISEMINSSKQEEQKEKQRLEQEQTRQLHQSSPGYGVKHVQEAIAVVTSPTYAPPSLTLEEKTVRSDSSVSLPSSPINNRIERDFSMSDQEVKESKSQEIQTDSITTADKGVDSNSLPGSVETYRAVKHSRSIPMVRDIPASRVNPKSDFSSENNDLSSSDENDFLQNVLASKKYGSQSKVEPAVNETEQAPPPPSPTAMQQLIEEFEEEEEDVDAQERKEIELAMRRESEIKEFTDKIYNRLSSLLGSQEEMDDNVFEEDDDSVKPRGVDELFSRLEKKRESPYSSSSSEEDMALYKSSSSKIPSSEVGQNKMFAALESSSSLTTTTSSDSDPYEEPAVFQPSKSDENSKLDAASESEEDARGENEPNVFVFPEIETAQVNEYNEDSRLRRNSREYHSDDDVATGRGIPDYYDDRPLWTRRQKTPGQLSAAMMAIRRRERRERWLKKRRRNKTDLLSTGSSDTGSEYAREDEREIKDGDYFRYDDDDEFAENEKMIQRQEMGSGILTSPKYTKPILPFGSNASSPRTEQERTASKIAAERSYYRVEKSKSLSDEDIHVRDTFVKSKVKRGDNLSDEDDKNRSLDKLNIATNPERFSSDSNLAIPGIEETFNELMSVKHILEGIQNRTPANEIASSVKCLPLTTENVKSIRDYYKDCYSSGNGRRSRMSATDRTESDLDIYSENRDDESTDSNFNADDEEDEDNQEPYATADDDPAATGGSGSTGQSGSHRDSRYRPGEDDDSETNVVVSCTFYNSNAFPTPAAEALDAFQASPTPVARNSVKSTPKTLTPTAQDSMLNSDEEFWAGSAAVEESYKQVVTAADAVSSTFQNAREQMHEIQHHLQALRRQMEVLQDDLSTTSLTLNPDRTLDASKK
ncbi:microtubule-associated protein futsch [Biomphalaria glabrata]|nr:microtubule-associated protein futsch [Biomphalaria glabrata]